MTTQATRTRKTKAEAAKAEEFIEAATAQAKAKPPAGKRKNPTPWPCTAEQIVAERDTAGRSWAQVAVNLGLGSPGQARKAYTALTGKPHHESQMTGRRATRAVSKGRKVTAPGWDDDSDQDAIAERLNGEWIEASGEGTKNYMPAHWSGSDIVVRRTSGSYVYEEEIQVKYVVEFTFGKSGTSPLGVTFICRYTGHFRTIQVAEIIEVR
jgi:hypothetical protein